MTRMKLFWVFLLIFLQINLMLLASNSSNLDLQERNTNIKETEELSEDSQLHITAVSKKGGGGGGSGGGSGGSGRGRGSGRGGGGRGGSGGRDRGGGGTFYGAAGAAGIAGAAGARSRAQHHRNGSGRATAQLGLTLPAVLFGLGIYLIQF